MAGRDMDKIDHPTSVKRSGGIKDTNQGASRGPKHEPGKYNPYQRKQKP